MTKTGKKLATLLLSLVMLVAFMPTLGTQMAYAETGEGTLLSGDDLNGTKVRIRPAGSFKPLSINKDGSGNQNCVHLYYQGKSSQFYLEKKDEDSYHIFFYEHYYDTQPRWDGDCRLDLEDKGGYSKEGQVIHVVSGNENQMNKRWQFIRQEDGTYYIRNKLTNKYWSLEGLADNPDKLFKNNTKLVQSSTPLKWDIEVVTRDSRYFKSKARYDSRNFTYNGNIVSSNNWMSALPDDLKITDISIPGTHDSATARLMTSQGSMSTQRYDINEMLNCGVRHFDLRTAFVIRYVYLVHSDNFALAPVIKERLTLNMVMDWIYDFLEENPGEIVIIQPKMDLDEEGVTDKRTYELLKGLALERDSRIWAGDHVPTLGEARGKVIIISRLNPDKTGGDFNIERDGKTVQWALDCHSWRDSKDKSSALTASGTNYEVWTQDNYSHNGSGKKPYIEKTLYGNKDNGYTNGTQYHYDTAKMNGKDAWIFNYTSASYKPLKDSFDICKEIHQWMYDRSDDYNRESSRIVRSDTFTGVMAFDFMDGLMSTFIYKTNFHRQYVTVHGYTVDGEEVTEPLVIQLGENDGKLKMLSETTRMIIEGQFSKDGYKLIPSYANEYLTETKVTSQTELDQAAAQLHAKIFGGGAVPDDLYVLLSKPIDSVEATIEVPVCGKEIDVQGNPAPNVTVEDNPYYEVELVDGKPNAHWLPTGFTMKSGSSYAEEFVIVPKFGGHFARSKGIQIHNSISYDARWRPLDPTVPDEDIRLYVTAMSNRAVHDIQHVDQVEPGCTSPGTKEHYKCAGCERLFLDADGKRGVEEYDLMIPALGHVPGDPVDEETTATCTEAGSHDQVIPCSRCGEALSRTPIPDPALGHEWIVGENTDPDGWSTWSTGESIHEERTCGRCGEKEERIYELDHEHGVGPIAFRGEVQPTCTTPGTRECTICDCGAPIKKIGDEWVVMTDEDLIIPATGHTPSEAARENETPPTCTDAGNYDEVIRCATCGELISSEYVVVEPQGHTWGEPTYEADWEDGGLVTAQRVCVHDSEHVETETVPVAEEITVQPTCEVNGSKYYYAEFENEAFERQQSDPVEVEALGHHSWDEGKVTQEPTCDDPGILTYTCTRCGETETEEIPKVEHETYTVEGEDSATCTKGGIQETREVCSLCGATVAGSFEYTESLGHAFGEPTYEWADDMRTVTATRVCQREGCNETETETTAEVTEWVMEESSCEAAGKIKYDAEFENEEFGTLEKIVEVEALGHDWGEWVVTKEPTKTTAGERQRVCNTDPSHVEKEVIPATGYAPGADPNQKGIDGTAVGPGASEASADKAITGMTKDSDPKGSVYAKLKLRSTKQTKTAITLKWSKPAQATKYVLYGNKCGSKNKMKKIGTYKGSSKKLTKVAGKKIKKGTYYKFILVALDKNNNVVSTSKVIHIATKGGKVTNPKKVTVKKGKTAITSVTVKKGKTVKVKNSVTKVSKKLKLKTHRKVKYESSNKKIATVTSKGKIKGVKKGTCYIYAYAQNGVAKKVKVTVK